MDSTLKIGWAEIDITPEESVLIRGQRHLRVSEGVKDPLSATALALESLVPGESPQGVVMVSCDIIGISNDLRDAVRDILREELPELAPDAVFLFATHTHTGPQHGYIDAELSDERGEFKPYPFIDLDVMRPSVYTDFASRRIADVVKAAWEGRSKGGVAYGLGHAVVGRNRIMVYNDGRARMYGRTDNPDFSHVEGYEDHTVNFLATYLPDGTLVGLIVNFAAPAQAEGMGRLISADFISEMREELRARFGEKLYVLTQISAAGDQDSRPPVDAKAEERMSRLAGFEGSPRDIWRRELAVRIAEAASRAIPLIQKEIDWQPVFAYHVEVLPLPRRIITEADVRDAAVLTEGYKTRYEELLAEAQQIPLEEREPYWYHQLSRMHGLTQYSERVAQRFELQQKEPMFPIEVQVLRLGDVGFVTNPFELYLDYGMQIKARSPAMQTFVIQLAGPGSYLPTARSIAGGAYGAVPASTQVGVEGGAVLVDWSVDNLQKLWDSGQQ